jgi:hypothetical protein
MVAARTATRLLAFVPTVPEAESVVIDPESAVMSPRKLPPTTETMSGVARASEAGDTVIVSNVDACTNLTCVTSIGPIVPALAWYTCTLLVLLECLVMLSIEPTEHESHPLTLTTTST